MNIESFSWLYIISEGPDGPVKVGVSSDPVGRLASLQTGNSRPLRIVKTYRASIGQVYAVESMFHFDFQDRNILGEWFDLSESLILECMPDFFESNGYQIDRDAA